MNTVEIGLSFLEGLALIASPCILPVLPLVLSASVEGGRKRPFGIILGFVIAFTLFALLSRKLVMAFHIDLDAIKYGSLILLALFGLVLLSETLSAKFSALTQHFASAGNNLSVNTKEGFSSGIVIGMLIGLVWTPCAGPILAAVLVQVIRQQNDLRAFFLIAAFAFGAGVPMLIISLTGRKIMAKLRFFSTHSEAVRKAFGVIILLAVAFIASGADVNSLMAKTGMPVASTQAGLVNALDKPYPAPEFAGIDAWLNSNPLTMASLKGKVVLVDFWTYSCINCVRTLPYITEWDRKYRDKGLVIIGVSAPEFEFEKSQANVEAAVAAHHIEYPVALDNRLDTWTNFQNQYWPAHYLIDKNGQVVYTHFGEGEYNVTENNIRFLLSLNQIESAPSEAAASSRGQTPETYLGSERASNFSSPEEVTCESQTFSLPTSVPEAAPASTQSNAKKTTSTAVFASGCFWATEAAFDQIKGVIHVESGYSGGTQETANYPAVCTGNTGHAEAVQVTYDPGRISYDQLLSVFFAAHDPTELDRQGNDTGPQYRSAIFYADDAQKQAAEAKIQELTQTHAFPDPIVTAVEPLKTFFAAEEFHQNYVHNHPDDPYIQSVSIPKVEKVREKYPELLKMSE